MEFKHYSVLLKESVDYLDVKSDGIYVDATLGGGGHSYEILRRGAKCVIGIDQDIEAIDAATKRLYEFRDKVVTVNRNFSDIKSILDELGIEKIDGVLLDLGVSSYQLDTAERGFSYHSDAALDMRMSKTGLSAKDVVNTYSENELYRVITNYGEEKFAKMLEQNV